MTPADLEEGKRLHALSQRYLARKDTPSHEEIDGHLGFGAWLYTHAAELLRMAEVQWPSPPVRYPLNDFYGFPSVIK